MNFNSGRHTTRLSPKVKDLKISQSSHFPLLMSTWKRLPSDKKKDFKSFERMQNSGQDLFGKSVSQYLKKLKGLNLVKGLEAFEAEEAELAFSHTQLNSPKNISLLNSQAKLPSHRKSFKVLLPSITVLEIDYKTAIKKSISPHRIYSGNLEAANDLSTLKLLNIQAIISIDSSIEPNSYPFVKGYLNLSYEDSADLSKLLPAIVRFMDLHLPLRSVLVQSDDLMLSKVVIMSFLIKHFKESLGKVYKLVKSADPSFRITRKLHNELKFIEANNKKL